MNFELKFASIIPLGVEQMSLAKWHSKVKAYHIPVLASDQQLLSNSNSNALYDEYFSKKNEISDLLIADREGFQLGEIWKTLIEVEAISSLQYYLSFYCL
jgi:hypothetical protein